MTFNSKVLAQEGWYISPGVQIGIDSRGKIFRSAQVTLGLLIEEYHFTSGLTIGYKWFRKFDKSVPITIGIDHNNYHHQTDICKTTKESIIKDLDQT